MTHQLACMTTRYQQQHMCMHTTCIDNINPAGSSQEGHESVGHKVLLKSDAAVWALNVVTT